MKKQVTDPKRTCLKQLQAEGKKEVLSRALMAEAHLIYTRYDLIHKAP